MGTASWLQGSLTPAVTRPARMCLGNSPGQHLTCLLARPVAVVTRAAHPCLGNSSGPLCLGSCALISTSLCLSNSPGPRVPFKLARPACALQTRPARVCLANSPGPLV